MRDSKSLKGLKFETHPLVVSVWGVGLPRDFFEEISILSGVHRKMPKVIASSKRESNFVYRNHLHATLYAQNKPANPNIPMYPNNSTRKKFIQV
jgi:hypothetical protein